MDFDPQHINGFELQGAIARAWYEIAKGIVKDISPKQRELELANRKQFIAYAGKLEDNLTMLAFGYINRIGEKTGNPKVMQATIVNSFVRENSSDDWQQQRHNKRQDFSRRCDALEFFGLIDREKLSAVAVQLSVTSYGEECRRKFNKRLYEELFRRGGDDQCIAAE